MYKKARCPCKVVVLLIYIYTSKADPGEGPGGPPPLFLDKTETRRAEKKKFLEIAPLPPYLRVWMTTSLPPSLSEGLDTDFLPFLLTPLLSLLKLPAIDYTTSSLSFSLVWR